MHLKRTDNSCIILKDTHFMMFCLGMFCPAPTFHIQFLTWAEKCPLSLSPRVQKCPLSLLFLETLPCPFCGLGETLYQASIICWAIIGMAEKRWQADVGPLMVVFGSSLPSSTKKKNKQKKHCQSLCILLLAVVNARKMCKLVSAFTEIWLMMYMHDHWTELSYIRTPVGYKAREATIYIFPRRCA